MLKICIAILNQNIILTVAWHLVLLVKNENFMTNEFNKFIVENIY